MGNKNVERKIEKIEYYVPQFEELVFRQKLYSDENTMNYGDEPFDFSPDKWQAWFDKWVKNPQGRFYAYLVVDKRFVGDINYHYDNKFDCFMIGIVILGEERNKEYAQYGLKLLCQKAKADGIKAICNLISSDRKSAIYIHEKLGFVKLNDKSTQNDVFLKKRL